MNATEQPIILRIHLFQNLHVVAGGEQTLDLGSPTTRSLFAYLVLHRERPVDRRRLAFLFWSRATEAAARRNLRQYIHRIRRALEPVDPQGEWLAAGGTTVQFQPQADLWLDVEAFRQGVKPGTSVDELRQAVSLYQGDLLEDVYEDWCEGDRQELRQLYLNALDRLTQAMQEGGDFEAALPYAQKWIAAEPYDEAAHRRLMTLYALNSERHRAIQHYQALQETLQRELGADPLPETQELLRSIQTGSPQLAVDIQPRLPPPVPVSPPIGLSPGAPLVGRQAEFGQLEEAFRQARSSQGRFVLVGGESGIGKTRLVQEYLQHIQAQFPGVPVLKAACHEVDAVLPYASLRPLLQQAMQLLPEAAFSPTPPWLPAVVQLLPSLAERFPHIPLARLPVEESPQVTTALLRLVLGLIERFAPQPLHLILDDLHWADSSTWNFLLHLAHYAASQPLLLIGVCRLEDLPVERGSLLRSLERNGLLYNLSLERLSTAETAILAEHLLSRDAVDPNFLHRLYRETEGNPFFIIEMVRAMQEIGWQARHPADEMSSAGLPLSIQWVVEARLDRLSPPSQELLGVAAAIGRTFDFALLGQISPGEADEYVRYVDEWLQRGLVDEEKSVAGMGDAGYGYDFSHEKIRQVAYARLSRARRQYIHGQIAHALENAIPPAEAVTLAYHYARSDQPHRALPYLIQSGEGALQVRSYQEARQFGLQAVSLLRRIPGPQQRSERLDLNLQLARAYALSGDLERAQETIDESEGLALALDDRPRLARLLHHAAQIHWLRGQPEAAGDYAHRLLRLAEELDDDQLVQAALRMSGRVSIALSAFDDAIAYLLRYVKLEDSPSPPVDLPVVLGYLGMAYNRVGSWGRAFETARRGVELAERYADQSGFPGLEGVSQAAAFARMQLAFVYADYRDWKACMQTLEMTPDPLQRPDIFPGAGTGGEDELSLTPLGFMLLGVRGLATAFLGRPDAGAGLIRPALDWAERTGYRVFHYLPRLFLAQALALGGQLDEAALEAEVVVEQARAAGNRWAVGVALRLAAETAVRQAEVDWGRVDWGRVENLLIESATLLRQVRARPDLARTYLALRRLYDRAGQIAWAVDCHFRATSIFEDLGMLEELAQAQGQQAGGAGRGVAMVGVTLRGPG